MEEVVIQKKGSSIIRAFGLVILIILMQFALSIPIAIIDIIIEEIGLGQISPYIGMLEELLINVLIIYLIIKRIRRKEEFELKLKNKPKIKECLFGILFLFAHFFIFANTVGLLIDKIQVSEWVVEAFDDMLINPFVAFVSICVFAPVFEEIIFRGIILEQLSKRYGMATSLIVSGFIFGLIHFNLHQGANAFFIGIIIGFIYLKTKSLLLCMFWHFANNFLVFISAMYVSDTVSDTVPSFSIVQLIIGIILLIAAYRFFNKRPVDQEQELSLVDA
ncbi:CPBP family intramembrane glutamic endopeptidase [Wukongibacter baidiensis]|uniref:CPBP family intramembrane glutamic endopeptidase n=1 Tax=Wukongibacter baidiensis TaxID=1723361 RepID=UPI003D7F5A4C